MSVYVSPEFMKEYQEALKKAAEKTGISIESNTTYSSCGNTANGTWYASWGWDCCGKTEKDFIPTKIVFNPPATICFFPDGSKTIVKCAPDEEFIEEEGVMACIVKKIFKSRNAFKKLVASAYRQPKPEPKTTEIEPDDTTIHIHKWADDGGLTLKPD